MKIHIINGEFSVCKVSSYTQNILNEKFVFSGSTDSEKSLVCPIDILPENILSRDDGWRAFRFSGTLDFSLVGILANASSKLAEKGISIFAVSTFDTDYIFIKKNRFDEAIDILTENGYEVD